MVTSNLTQVLICFENLDAEGLEILLHDEHTYYDVPKEAFLTRLREFFDDFKTDVVPTEKLKIFPGACCNKSCDLHLGRTAYRFLGAMGVFFDLRFILATDESGNEFVKDIYTCHDLVTNERAKGIDHPTFLWVYEDDKVTTTLRQNHDLLVKQAEDAFSSYNLYFDGAIVSLVEIKSWLDLHETTYLEIGGFKDDFLIHWKWDPFLKVYHDMHKLYSFLQEFSLDFEIAKEIETNPIPENKLLNYITSLEERLEGTYLKLYGSIFNIARQKDHFEVCIELSTTLLLEDKELGKLSYFLNWFDQERDKLIAKYFAFTSSELEEFQETTTSPFELYQVRKSLSYHLAIRERFRKDGVFIPYNLGDQFIFDVF
jgi:hypothetical protein